LLTISRFYKYYAGLALAAFLLASCKKQSVHLTFELIQTPVSSNINKSYWQSHNNGFICGGKRGESGFIYNTIDGGKNWNNLLETDGLSLYDIKFISDSIAYCCGENMCLYKSIDKGITWNKMDLTTHFDQFYNGVLRQIILNKNSFIIVGGKNDNIGIILTFHNMKINDGFRGFSNELRSGFSFSDSNYVSCGYGTAYKSKNDLSDYYPLKLSDDFFTDCITINSSVGIACGYNGGVYKVTSPDYKTEKLYEANTVLKKRLNFNSLFFKNENEGWVVGNNSELLKTSDGHSFQELETSEKSNFLSIVSNLNNELIISTSDGKLLRFSN